MGDHQVEEDGRWWKEKPSEITKFHEKLEMCEKVEDGMKKSPKIGRERGEKVDGEDIEG